jgi:hypothetical protein
MPRIAKAYIALIICSGAAVLLFAAVSWSSANLFQFFILLGFVAFSSTLKIRIPGIDGTMSPNFVFLLLAMLSCRFSQVVAITLVAALVQSLWFAKRAHIVQIAFSAAALLVSATIAFDSSHALFESGTRNAPVAFVVFAGSLYLAFNSTLVSLVIGLVEGQALVQVGRTCLRTVFPYFGTGILFAGLVSGAFPDLSVWKSAIAVLPVVVISYLYFRQPANVVASAPISPAYEEDDELVEVGAHSTRS